MWLSRGEPDVAEELWLQLLHMRSKRVGVVESLCSHPGLLW
jgi:hypothetical protein